MESNVINPRLGATVVEVSPARITPPGDVKAGQTLRDDSHGLWFAVWWTPISEWFGTNPNVRVVRLVPLDAHGDAFHDPYDVDVISGPLRVIAEVRS